MPAKPHEVPTHLNVEDKVVFGLTVRQFLFMLAGSSAAYTSWNQLTGLPGSLRVIVVLVAVSLTLGFARARDTPDDALLRQGRTPEPRKARLCVLDRQLGPVPHGE